MIIRKALLLLPLLLLVGACDGMVDNELSGSIETAFVLDFDQVNIYRQEFNDEFIALKVEYVKIDKDSKRYPVIVTASAPVSKGQKKDLTTDGSLSRAFDGSDFDDIREGHVVFNELGDVGDDASGEFHVVFVKGSTLDGKFSATLELLSN